MRHPAKSSPFAWIIPTIKPLDSGKGVSNHPGLASGQGRSCANCGREGEDYLYHKAHFAFVDLPRAVAKKFRSLEAATA